MMPALKRWDDLNIPGKIFRAALMAAWMMIMLAAGSYIDMHLPDADFPAAEELRVVIDLLAD